MISGGGLVDNLPHVLPSDCDAVIDTKSWKVPPIFQLLEKHGRVEREEMYPVFNMGIGMAAIVAPNDAAAMGKQLRARVIGRIEPGEGRRHLERSAALPKDPVAQPEALVPKSERGVGAAGSLDSARGLD